MPETYPTSLPQAFFLQAEKTRQATTLRSDTDMGAPKVRKRFTAAIENIKGLMKLNGTQMVTFETFFVTTLVGGTLTFNWTDPVDGSTVEMRFVAPPAWSLVSGSGAGGAVADRRWESMWEVEVLP